MQKKVTKPNVPSKSSDGKHTGRGKIGNHPVMIGTSKNPSLKRKTIRKKDGTKNKSHNVKRNKMGRLGKQAGQEVVFKPFMM